jgi:hypothetical protein
MWCIIIHFLIHIYWIYEHHLSVHVNTTRSVHDFVLLFAIIANATAQINKFYTIRNQVSMVCTREIIGVLSTHTLLKIIYLVFSKM